MKKIFPLLIAVLVAGLAMVLLSPPPSKTVVTAAYDLRAGHVLVDTDLTLRSVQQDSLSPDAITDKSLVIGQPLRIDRSQGDVLRASQLGNLISLTGEERGVAVHVTDASGVAGLLVPGQMVGVVASIPQQSTSGEPGTFSKATIEGLRVLYIDPEFAANMGANVVPQATKGSGLSVSGVNTNDRAREGSVLLAVPSSMQMVYYDFSASGGVNEISQVNAVELLSALSAMPGATITLYLMPQEGSSQLASPGLWLPDLIRTPVPTATPRPGVTPTAPVIP
jgi:pilus assembly protein CpaB